MAAWTTKAPAAPSQTARGPPRVDITREVNIVLSGKSPKKMIGKTVAAMARLSPQSLTETPRATRARWRGQFKASRETPQGQLSPWLTNGRSVANGVLREPNNEVRSLNYEDHLEPLSMLHLSISSHGRALPCRQKPVPPELGEVVVGEGVVVGVGLVVVVVDELVVVGDGFVVVAVGLVVVVTVPAGLTVTTSDHLPQVSVTLPLTFPGAVSWENQ